MTFVLRNYQQEAIDAVRSDWDDGSSDVVLALGTGLGKTEIGIHLLKQTMKLGERALWLAHTSELLFQPLERIKKYWPDIDVGIVKAQQNEVAARFILGSVQTVCRLNRLQPVLDAGRIDYLVTDEAHHSAADSYLEIYKALRAQNPNLKHVGLTATPKRSDNRKLRDVFDKLSFQMGILKGVRQGWLVPPKGMQIETGIDTSGVKVSHGDFVVGDLADVLDANEWHVKVFEAFAEHAADKQCIAYTPTVATSKRLVEEFTERGIKARHVDGTTPKDKRKESVRLFREQKIQVLSSCAVFLEGFDAPSANCILMARPTQSHVLLTQVIGRGLRIFPGKTECLVLMFATTDARLLTIFDLGESKELKKAKEAAEELAIEGVSGAISLFDEDKIDGVGLYAKVVNLFSSSTAAWYRDGAEFSLGLGEHEGHQRTLFITPPNGDNEWHLWGLGRSVKHEGGAWSRNRETKYGAWTARELSCGPDMDELMAQAADIVERRGQAILSEKKKRWRKEPATDGQKRFARKWASANAVAKLTRGQAAQLISHGVAKNALGRL